MVGGPCGGAVTHCNQHKVNVNDIALIPTIIWFSTSSPSVILRSTAAVLVPLPPGALPVSIGLLLHLWTSWKILKDLLDHDQQ